MISPIQNTELHELKEMESVVQEQIKKISKEIEVLQLAIKRNAQVVLANATVQDPPPPELSSVQDLTAKSPSAKELPNPIPSPQVVDLKERELTVANETTVDQTGPVPFENEDSSQPIVPLHSKTSQVHQSHSLPERVTIPNSLVPEKPLHASEDSDTLSIIVETHLKILLKHQESGHEIRVSFGDEEIKVHVSNGPELKIPVSKKTI
jgi:hypothetical protein